MRSSLQNILTWFPTSGVFQRPSKDKFRASHFTMARGATVSPSPPTPQGRHPVSLATNPLITADYKFIILCTFAVLYILIIFSHLKIYHLNKKLFLQIDPQKNGCELDVHFKIVDQIDIYHDQVDSCKEPEYIYEISRQYRDAKYNILHSITEKAPLKQIQCVSATMECGFVKINQDGTLITEQCGKCRNPSNIFSVYKVTPAHPCFGWPEFMFVWWHFADTRTYWAGCIGTERINSTF